MNFKIDHQKMQVLQNILKCPHCNISWDGGEIYKHFEHLREIGDEYYRDKTDEELVETADNYGWSKTNPIHFRKNIIGIEIQGEYDGILYWECSSCKSRWHRFTGQKIK